MEMSKNKQLKHITHESIPLFIDDESTVLLLGSLPSVKSREDGFYYAHPRNKFFKVLPMIFNEEEPVSIDDRKTFLKKHHIALYDVIYECDIHGSSDVSIKNAKVIDLKQILIDYPKIKTIGVNGGKAKSLFDKYLLKIVNAFDVGIVYLPSTSPANAKMNLESLKEQYIKVLCA